MTESSMLQKVQDGIRFMSRDRQNALDRSIAINVARTQGFKNPEILMTRSEKQEDDLFRIHTYLLMDPDEDAWNRLITVQIDYANWRIHSRVWKANSSRPNECPIDGFVDATEFYRDQNIAYIE